MLESINLAGMGIALLFIAFVVMIMVFLMKAWQARVKTEKGGGLPEFSRERYSSTERISTAARKTGN